MQVFAMECVQKIINACEASGEPAHFDLVLAKEKLKTNPNGMFCLSMRYYISSYFIQYR